MEVHTKSICDDEFSINPLHQTNGSNMTHKSHNDDGFGIWLWIKQNKSVITNFIFLIVITAVVSIQSREVSSINGKITIVSSQVDSINVFYGGLQQKINELDSGLIKRFLDSFPSNSSLLSVLQIADNALKAQADLVNTVIEANQSMAKLVNIRSQEISSLINIMNTSTLSKFSELDSEITGVKGLITSSDLAINSLTDTINDLSLSFQADVTELNIALTEVNDYYDKIRGDIVEGFGNTSDSLLGLSDSITNLNKTLMEDVTSITNDVDEIKINPKYNTSYVSCLSPTTGDNLFPEILVQGLLILSIKCVGAGVQGAYCGITSSNVCDGAGAIMWHESYFSSSTYINKFNNTLKTCCRFPASPGSITCCEYGLVL